MDYALRCFPYLGAAGMSLQGKIAAWSYLQDLRRGLMDDMARPLEARAAELADLGSDYARFVGVDRDGRVRFTVRGFGQQTFTIAELDGA